VANERAKPRVPFVVDVSSAVHAGENVLALRVDHSKITDLSLGGILRPVLLIQKADAGKVTSHSQGLHQDGDGRMNPWPSRSHGLLLQAVFVVCLMFWRPCRPP